MNKLLSIGLVAIAVITFIFSSPAYADAGAGKAVFSSVCITCHMGGGNTIMPNKTLSKADLEANGMYDKGKIVTQVTNGKGAMPPWGGQLSAEQIDNVADYVLAQADTGW